jgi:hypothetical protein
MITEKWESTMSISKTDDVEVARYPLTDLEQDALNNFPVIASANLVKTLREAVMIFHNLAHQLWGEGVRLRIVPEGKRMVDIRECAHLDPEYGESANGIYFWDSRLIVVREETLLRSPSVNQKYHTFIHEVAHAIWAIILWPSDRGHVLELFKKELCLRPHDSSYRMYNVFEFFAESFLYYVTPYRKDRILSVSEYWCAFGGMIREVEREFVAQNNATLKNANPDMLLFLDSKFKGLIDPELMMSRPLNNWDEERWSKWDNLYLPVIYTSGSETEEVNNW